MLPANGSGSSVKRNQSISLLIVSAGLKTGEIDFVEQLKCRRQHVVDP